MVAPRPILLIHGQDHFVIPPVNLDLMYDLAREPKSRWLAPGLHSNVMTADFDGYQTRVIQFLDQARSVPASMNHAPSQAQARARLGPGDFPSDPQLLPDHTLTRELL